MSVSDWLLVTLDGQVAAGAVSVLLFALGSALMAIGGVRMLDPHPATAKLHGTNDQPVRSGKRLLIAGALIILLTWLVGMTYFGVRAVL